MSIKKIYDGLQLKWRKWTIINSARFSTKWAYVNFGVYVGSSEKTKNVSINFLLLKILLKTFASIYHIVSCMIFSTRVYSCSQIFHISDCWIIYLSTPWRKTVQMKSSGNCCPFKWIKILLNQRWAKCFWIESWVSAYIWEVMAPVSIPILMAKKHLWNLL